MRAFERAAYYLSMRMTNRGEVTSLHDEVEVASRIEEILYEDLRLRSMHEAHTVCRHLRTEIFGRARYERATRHARTGSYWSEYYGFIRGLSEEERNEQIADLRTQTSHILFENGLIDTGFTGNYVDDVFLSAQRSPSIPTTDVPRAFNQFERAPVIQTLSGVQYLSGLHSRNEEVFEQLYGLDDDDETEYGAPRDVEEPEPEPEVSLA
eukprot:g349.t1